MAKGKGTKRKKQCFTKHTNPTARMGYLTQFTSKRDLFYSKPYMVCVCIYRKKNR